MENSFTLFVAFYKIKKEIDMEEIESNFRCDILDDWRIFCKSFVTWMSEFSIISRKKLRLIWIVCATHRVHLVYETIGWFWQKKDSHKNSGEINCKKGSSSTFNWISVQTRFLLKHRRLSFNIISEDVNSSIQLAPEMYIANLCYLEAALVVISNYPPIWTIFRK